MVRMDATYTARLRLHCPLATQYLRK